MTTRPLRRTYTIRHKIINKLPNPITLRPQPIRTTTQVKNRTISNLSRTRPQSNHRQRRRPPIVNFQGRNSTPNNTSTNRPITHQLSRTSRTVTKLRRILRRLRMPQLRSLRQRTHTQRRRHTQRHRRQSNIKRHKFTTKRIEQESTAATTTNPSKPKNH